MSCACTTASGAAGGTDAEFRHLMKALWVWGDRILAPEDLESVITAHGINTLFLYTPPGTAEELLRGSKEGIDHLSALRAGGCSIYLMAGEPDWAFGVQELPEHVRLLVRLQSALPGLFGGIHLDVEPNALPEWREHAAKSRLIE